MCDCDDKDVTREETHALQDNMCADICDELWNSACCLCTQLYSRFYRFMARFKGRSRGCGVGGAGTGSRVAPVPPRPGMYPAFSHLVAFLFIASSIFRISDACSSRSTPKPRPPSPTVRPNITFQTYACPSAYAAWYCLNGATCFAVKVGESVLYNCECADGYMGQRCEYKDLDGSYLPSRDKVMLETASIAGGATFAVLVVVVLFIAGYTYLKHRRKQKYLNSMPISVEELDARPFGRRSHHTVLRTVPARHHTTPPPDDPGPPDLEDCTA